MNLLIVLLIFNLVFWLLVIWFRILFDCDIGRCCTTPSDDSEEPTGHNNPTFEDDGLSTIAERMESPPTYEEALKYDQFGFDVSPPVHTTSISTVLASLQSLTRSNVPSHQDLPSPSTEVTTQRTQNPPIRVPDVRSRSSTSGSTCPLTPISEEEIDDVTPVTIVIDCIGVQASKLLEKCDTKVDLPGGESLSEHSGC